ncbi:transcriptional adapter 2-alpha [Babesia microti strain RI]|uniref:Transcriptional adapter 2-alpha n=1 Tax=Babesia microti (strain RI) TaxID=1133968 RepID=A0A1R4AC69_BABMR|nr:transcriptional adapter 2-alpha [Babesia microti strain RI]SJK86596.1 transcriptional adapter 2-alpha [Babesia microti strain RI]|eukprot:XP_021338735.1 transcriptional adapter 2-alpha [Babesia microti strain RI]
MSGNNIEGKSTGIKSSQNVTIPNQFQNNSSSESNIKSMGIKSKQSPSNILSSASNCGDDKNNPSTGKDSGVKAMGPYEQCNICGRLCDRAGHIQCAECENFHICLTCFCSGSEKPSNQSTAFVPTDNVYKHKNNHKYIPIGVNNMPLFTIDWTSEQELLLLEGLSKYGLGNWKQISELVNISNGYPKSASNCQKHYYEVYINSANPPLPDLNSIILPDKNQPPPPCSPIDECTDSTIASPETTTHSNTNKPQTFGYWPLRGDFDVEYDNDAELILADMEFRDDDTPQQKELKLKVIEIYNSKLDERIYRKRIIIERGLLDSKSTQQREKKLTSEERELYNILRPFNRFHSPESHEQLIQLLVQERKIRSRLYQLLLWKSLGLESIQDVYEYEYDRATKRRHFENESRIITSIAVRDKNARTKSNVKKETATSVVTTELDAKAKIISECLEEKEIEFCNTYGIPPIVFFMAKRVLLEEIATNPLISIDQNCKSLDLDVTKHGRLFDFILNLTPHAPYQNSELEPIVDLSALPLNNKGKIDSKYIASEILPPS